ncbi:helix-turn-helix domain-containing protein [Streptosporangium sp. KLBMP 9127]|nr:helix-turn-helix domain-containing protein [Streptosporangium sp. KLBMP 9127]
MNDNLRHALTRARLHPVDIAAQLAVDPKTVNRWINGRIPYPRHRWAIADLLGVDEAELWPDVAPHQPAMPAEIRTVHPHRWAVPPDTWRRLFQSATRDIGILTYSGLFITEDAGLLHVLTDRAQTGVHVRILLGDPDSSAVATRGEEETIGGAVMAARTRNAIALCQPLHEVEGIEIRLHDTVLYNSIYRADDELLINTHVYGMRAAEAPVIHLHDTAGAGTAATYLDSFERVWNGARPAPQMP